MLRKIPPGRKRGMQVRHRRLMPPWLTGKLTGALGRPAQSLVQNQQFPAKVSGIFGATIHPLKVPV